MTERAMWIATARRGRAAVSCAARSGAVPAPRLTGRGGAMELGGFELPTSWVGSDKTGALGEALQLSIDVVSHRAIENALGSRGFDLSQCAVDL